MKSWADVDDLVAPEASQVHLGNQVGHETR